MNKIYFIKKLCITWCLFFSCFYVFSMSKNSSSNKHYKSYFLLSDTFKISTQANIGGTIDTFYFSFDTNINKRILYKANEGFYIDSIIINDTLFANDSINGYTFYNIQSNQKIRVVFSPICVSINTQTNYYDSSFQIDSVFINALNCRWHFRSSANWLRLLNPIDSGSKYLKFSIQLNTDTNALRMAQIFMGNIIKPITQFIGKRFYFIYTKANDGGVYDDTLFIKKDTNFTVHFQADSGYYIDSIIINDTLFANDSINGYTFYNIQANQKIRIVFYPFCATISNNNLYYDSATHIDSFLITAPNCKWKASTNASWIRINNPNDTGTKYLKLNITANNDTVVRTAQIVVGDKIKTIQQFNGKKYFFIEVDANEYGYIYPQKNTKVNADSSIVVSFTSLINFKVDSVWKNGIYLKDSLSQYTFNNVNDNQKLKIKFSYAPSSKFITIQNGTISPIGIQIKPDTTIRFTYLPNDGYQFDYVVANGQVYRDSTTHFTLTNINYNTRIAVFFKPIGNTITVNKKYKGINNKIDSIVTKVYPDSIEYSKLLNLKASKTLDTQTLRIDSNVITLKLSALNNIDLNSFNLNNNIITNNAFINKPKTTNAVIDLSNKLKKGELICFDNKQFPPYGFFGKANELYLDNANSTLKIITTKSYLTDLFENTDQTITAHFSLKDAFKLFTGKDLAFDLNLNSDSNFKITGNFDLICDASLHLIIKNSKLIRFEITNEFTKKGQLGFKLSDEVEYKNYFPVITNIPIPASLIPLFIIPPGIPVFADLEFGLDIEFALKAALTTTLDFTTKQTDIFGFDRNRSPRFYTEHYPKQGEESNGSNFTWTPLNAKVEGDFNIFNVAKLKFSPFNLPLKFNTNIRLGFENSLIYNTNVNSLTDYSSSLFFESDLSAGLQIGGELSVWDYEIAKYESDWLTLFKIPIYKKNFFGPPSIQSWQPYNITDNKAIVGFTDLKENLIDLSLTDRGILLGTSNNPTNKYTAYTKNIIGVKNEFILSNLKPNTTYYYKPFAVNLLGGYGYGNVVQFTTSATQSQDPNNPASNQYTLTTSITNGTITPTQNLNIGTQVKITYAASSGYKITAVYVNNIKQTATGLVSVDATNGYIWVTANAHKTINVITISKTGNNNLPPVGAGLSLANLEANMVTVPAGSFTMGATSEQTADGFNPWWSPATQQVTLSSYKICRFEVTQQLWQDVMGSNPSYFTMVTYNAR